MTNFEKRITSLTIEKLIQLEDEVLECEGCYCREFCESNRSEGLSCIATRKKWLNLGAEDD